MEINFLPVAEGQGVVLMGDEQQLAQVLARCQGAPRVAGYSGDFGSDADRARAIVMGVEMFRLDTSDDVQLLRASDFC